MKSLQNKLNLIKEGKGNRELFLKEARTMFPNVVTGALTFDQAVHNLTERGIISEGFIGVASKRPTNPDWFQIFNENVKAELKDTDKDVEKLETAGYDYKDEKNSNNLSMESILTGYYAEMKDPKNADKTEEELKEMVVKNLEKDPMHYMKDGAFGVKGIGYTDEAPGLKASDTDKMEPVKLQESKVSEYLGGRMDVPQNYGMDDDDEYYSSDYDKIANAEFGMDYDQLGPNEQAWVHDEAELNEIGMFHDPRTSGNFSDADDQWENGAYHVRFRMLKNKGVGEEKAKELADAYEDKPWEEVRRLLNLNEVNIFDTNPKAKKALEKLIAKGMSEKDAKKAIVDKMNASDREGERAEKRAFSLNEAKNKAMEKAVKEIEKKSELAKAEAKVSQIDELISELESKLSVTEADGMSDMVDKKKVKEIQKNIKFLEGKKKKYEKEKARLEGKYGEKKKEVMDEELETPNEEAGEQVEKMGYAEAVKEMLKRKGLKK